MASNSIPDPESGTGIFRLDNHSLSSMPGGESSPVLEMVTRSLVHLQASKALSTRHRIGEHFLCGPDYRLVCAMAEDVGMTPEAVLGALFGFTPAFDETTRIIDGRFLSLVISEDVPISAFPSIGGLVVESLSLSYLGLTELDLSAVPNLTKLYCDTELFSNKNRLTELDLSAVPHLTMLSCYGNRLTELDLSAVPHLTFLNCYANQITELDLSAVPHLTTLLCFANRLTELDLSSVPHLTVLNCYANQITELDLSAVPNLTFLDCANNQITELDLSAVPKLTELYCQKNQLTELDLSPAPHLTELNYDDQVNLI